MNLELTISGLCVLVMKSKQKQPTKPSAVELLLVDAHHPPHRPRLSYWPLQVHAEVEPDLCVNPVGRHIAELDLRGKVVSLRLTDNPHKKFTVSWGEAAPKVPPKQAAEAWMKWVPAANDLGMKGIRLGKAGQLPKGASARLILPPGELIARSVVRQTGKKDYLLWKFPAVGLQRALANEVVFRAEGFKAATFGWAGQEKALFSQVANDTLKVAISNDLEKVPLSYLDGLKKLDHTQHFAALAEPPATIQVPEVVEKDQRTGWPICHGVYFVDEG